MKKLFFILAMVSFSVSSLMAQNPTVPTPDDPEQPAVTVPSKNASGIDIPTGVDRPQVVAQPKHECKGHKDGEACSKPADQQCDDCKAKAAQKHECKGGEGHKCQKAEGQPQHECKGGEGHKCQKAEGQPQHECKGGEGHKCQKAEGQPQHACKAGEAKQCDKAKAEKKDCCKDKKMEGQKCNKPADQQCPDCKDKAKKN